MSGKDLAFLFFRTFAALVATLAVVPALAVCLNPNPNPNPAQKVVKDFDGDCKADIFWRNPSTGQTLIWLMNGTVIGSTGSPATVPSAWTVEGVGDFDGDGKADILWRNTASGTMLVWLMNGSSISATGSPATVGDASAGWVVQGIGDFDGDGKADILWQNTISGTVFVWKMNGTAIASAASPATVPPGAWTVEGVGDFDGDGKSDILWRNTSSGTMFVWLMNGSAITGTGSPATVGDASAGWAVRGVGDFDGDGKADIVWQNTISGTVFVWKMNGTTIGSTGSPATVPAGWSVEAVGDYNGDGRADLLWRNSGSGNVFVWLMNGTAIDSTGSPATVSDTNWQVANRGGATASILPPIVSNASATLKVLGIAASSVTGSIAAVDPQNLPLTYSLNTAPQLGVASISASTGAFTYSITGYASAASDAFSVTVSNGQTQSTAQMSVQLASDPLLTNQWHIQNVGQNAFASVLPVAGNDMNVAGAWTAGYSGKGIKVGIADSGLEAAHEDLAANVDVGNSFNFLTGLNDPTPAVSAPGFDHGTSVAGIIGSVAFNGKGGRGVAYDARLRGYNFLAPGAFSLANMATSLGSAPISADNDLFNASFGASTHALATFSGAYQAIATTSLTLRGGLGAAIVNAAGNDFKDWEASAGTGLCNAANVYGVSCGDPANDERRGGYVPIIVGAIDADGKHSSYSNTGSSIWISAPGGEFGLNSSFTTGSNFLPAIVTTNHTGCANSLYSTAVNSLDSKGANAFAPNCQYTAVMNGTSAATPNVAGVVAMMLEANPNLSVRDLKYILAKTAKKVDPSFAGVSSTNVISGSTIVLEQGWVNNSAGWSFSNRYGFGAVDAAAAVAMAKSYTTYLPAVQNSIFHQFLAAPPATIAPASPGGNFAVIPVAESFNTVEFVVVFLNIASTPGLLCNQVELKSPSGTKSILMHAANGFANTSVVNSRFLSNAFYGEPVNGNWTLTFFDFCTAGATPTQLSTTNPQLLGIVGH